jgi:hypothetical protein
MISLEVPYISKIASLLDNLCSSTWQVTTYSAHAECAKLVLGAAHRSSVARSASAIGSTNHTNICYPAEVQHIMFMQVHNTQ